MKKHTHRANRTEEKTMQWSGGDGRIHSDIVHIDHCRCGAKRMAEDPLGAWKSGAEEYTRHADKRRTGPIE